MLHSDVCNGETNVTEDLEGDGRGEF